MTTETEEKMGSTETRTGRVVAIAWSKELINGVGKELREEAVVTRIGIPGDKHHGETRYSSSRKAWVPNNRPITVLGLEATRGASERLGIEPIPHGGMGENFLVEGLGDLSDVTSGDQVHFLSPEGELRVVLEVEGQNDPCANLKVYHKQIVKELYGKRGLLCTVLKEGSVRTGDAARLVRDCEELYRA
jgi:MOSC domain-containing protein YiiM